MMLNGTRNPSTDNSRRTRPQETLVVDSRAGLTPAQMVERKLRGLLRGGPLPVSHLLNTVKGRGPV